MLLKEELTYKIRKAIFSVYNFWGPGLLENIYEESLVVELKNLGLNVERQKSVSVFYKNIELGCDYRIDLLIEGEVIVELKSVSQITDIHKKQLLTYLKVTGKQVGLLVNFNCLDILKGIVRIVN